MVCAPTSERLQVKVLRFFSAFFFFVSYHRDNLLKEWDLSTCTCLRSLQGHKGPVFCVKVGLGSFICAPFNEHKLLSLYFRYTTITLQLCSQAVPHRVVSCSADGFTRIWDLDSLLEGKVGDVA